MYHSVTRTSDTGAHVLLLFRELKLAQAKIVELEAKAVQLEAKTKTLEKKTEVLTYMHKNIIHVFSYFEHIHYSTVLRMLPL